MYYYLERNIEAVENKIRRYETLLSELRTLQAISALASDNHKESLAARIRYVKDDLYEVRTSIKEKLEAVKNQITEEQVDLKIKDFKNEE